MNLLSQYYFILTICKRNWTSLVMNLLKNIFRRSIGIKALVRILKFLNLYFENISSTIAEHYDQLATNYEDIYLKVGFPDPMKCAEFVETI